MKNTHPTEVPTVAILPFRWSTACLIGFGLPFCRVSEGCLLGEMGFRGLAETPTVTVLTFGYGRMPPSGAVADWRVYATRFLGAILWGVGSQT